jgi:hypothetical protein
MKKRLTAILLLAALAVSLSGCASLFKKEYLSVSKYPENGNTADSGEIIMITDYAELKNAIIVLINAHKTKGRLRFIDYKGTVQQDVSQAIWEVMAESALASYAVEYPSYDITPIVTFYEAVIGITYKHTPSEIADIRYVTGRSEFPEVFGPMLETLDDYVALRIISSTVTAEELNAAVLSAYEQNPAACVVRPNVNAQIHPESGLQRILEIELEYGWKRTELQKMKSTLSDRIEMIMGGVTSVKPAESALQLFERLAYNCVYDPTGALRSAKPELLSGLGVTAYGALVEGFADSEGFAVAYSALCRAAGIECLVVHGEKDGQPHVWNIISLNGSYYHADATAFSNAGLSGAFMLSDAQMAGTYIWDTTKYPACDGEDSYSDLVIKVF